LDVVGSCCGVLSYKTAPHNRYQPHPTKPDQYTPNAVKGPLFS